MLKLYGLIALLLLSIFSYIYAESGQGDIDFGENQNVIGRFHYGQYDRAVFSITQWQYDIMNDEKIPFKTMLYLRTLNTLECGDENGFCISYHNGNTVDAGPFQINQIHGEDHEYSVYLIRKGQKEVAEAKKTGDWSKVIETRNTIYRFQVKWTWERCKRLVKQFHLSEDREKRMKSLAKLHNGGKYREDYSKRAVSSYNILRNYYSDIGIY